MVHHPGSVRRGRWSSPPRLVLTLELPRGTAEHGGGVPGSPPRRSPAPSAAAARGLLVQYPLGMGEVPRYEGSMGIPAGALSSRPASL